MNNSLSFFTNEYRYEPASNPAIAAVYDNARAIILDTNLTQAGAKIRAMEELALGSGKRMFEVTVESIVTSASFLGSPLAVQLFSEQHGLTGETFTVVAVSEVNLKEGFSTLQVR